MSEMVEYVPLVLPSKGKPYKDFNASALAIRSMIGRDEKILAEISSENLDKKFNALIKAVTRGVDPLKLTLGDRKYILLWLIMNTHGKMHAADFYCEHCMQKVSTEVDFSTINNVELPDTFEPVHNLILEKSGDIWLRLLTVEDEMKTTEYEKHFGSAWVYRFALGVVDQEKSLAEIVKRLEEMPSPDFQKVKAFHETYDHGPNMEAHYECPKCGGEGLVAVTFRIEYFLPYGKALKSHYAEAV